MSFSRSNGDGNLISVIEFAVEHFGWSLDYALDQSFLMIVLLMRRYIAQNSPKGLSGISLMDLEDMEASDGLSWEEQVRRNHEQLRQSGLLSV